MLNPIEVVSPVSACSRKVKVRGQLPGTMIRIYANGAEIGSDVAQSTTTFIGLTRDPIAGEKITATQTQGASTSKPLSPSLAATVPNPPLPQTLGRVFSRAGLVECGTCLWLEGIEPGAQVTVSVAGRPPVVANSDWLALHIETLYGLAPADQIVVRQQACGTQGPPVALPGVRRQANPMAPVSPPTIEQPLVACQKAISVRDVYPGSTISISHNGTKSSFCFGSVEGTVRLPRPLSLGDTLDIWQEFKAYECRREGERAKYQVTQSAPPAPSFPQPICMGDLMVRVSGLIEGAAVEFFERDNPEPIGRAGAFASTCDLPAPPLNETAPLGVRQSLCPGGPWSGIGWTRVIPRGGTRRPLIVEPLFEGGTAIGIRKLDRGTWVRVRSWKRQAEISYWTLANGDERVDVPVFAPLERLDEITVETIQCGVPMASAPALVRGPADLVPPQLQDEASDLGGSVYVRDVVPGAIVEVEAVSRVDEPFNTVGTIVGIASAGDDTVSVPIPRVASGTLLRARQRLGANESRPGKVVALARVPTVHYVGSTTRICQLTGSADPTGLPHPFDTEGIALNGTDLGIPVEHGGRLLLFFGDCSEHPESAKEGDPVAWTTDDPEMGVPGLNWVLNADGHFRRLIVAGLPPRSPGVAVPQDSDLVPHLDNFEVPTGGFSYGGKLYLFIGWEKTNGTDPGGGNQMRSSLLAASADPVAHDFTTVFNRVSTTLGNPMGQGAPAGRWLVQACPVVVHNADWPGLPSQSGDGVLIFGTSLYHQSDVYLSWAPLDPTQDPVLPHPTSWLFFIDPPLPDRRNWLNQSELGNHHRAPKPLLDLPIPEPIPADPVQLKSIHGLGELSVVYSPELRHWFMSYLGGELRVSRLPWKDWSRAEAVFSVSDPTRDAGNSSGLSFTLATGQEITTNSFIWPDRNGNLIVYAPYLIGRWMRWDKSNRTLRVYYTLSAHIPYHPHLMRSELTDTT